ncbi:MAG: S8 family serine peptidase, partial [bacterium]
MLKAATLFLVCLYLSVPAPSVAGELAPGLVHFLADKTGDDEVKVLVSLRDQVDISALQHEFRLAKTSRPARHRIVVEQLQVLAERTQGPLIDELSARQQQGQIRGWATHWLLNSVVVTGTVDAILALTERSDVDRVELDLKVSLEAPVGHSAVSAKTGGAKGIGTTEGVLAVRAPQVWRVFGITGQGTIVGCLDTGVDGEHIALRDRWRGNFAPAAECWLDIVDFGDATPVDRHYHGTHVMGTLCGVAPDDTIGVAPGAVWIACNGINQPIGSELDNDIIRALEWFADPDGDAQTMDEVPDVVQNSWSVNEGFEGYYDCDSRWWDVIDHCEAAGCVLVFAAGNNGPQPNSIGSPADRGATPTSCFSVGSTLRTPPYEISSFSSRGPTNCDSEYPIKPELVAPGTEIYSTKPGGGYQLLNGTSMAGPHVAGVVALMRTADPDIDVVTIKEILMATATDLGETGEDDTYGHGLVDAYAAVVAVLGPIGVAEGRVTDPTTGLPITGAEVRDVGGYNRQVTDGDGHYRLILTAGEHLLEVTEFGYFEATQSVSVLANQTTTADVQLSTKPRALLYGHVFGPDDFGVPAATVTALDTPLAPVTSTSDGYYEISLPIDDVYTLLSRAPDLGAVEQTVYFAGVTELNFRLPILSVEDFETGDFVSYPW